MEIKKRRIFLDSNVILSGLFSGTGAPRLILDVLSLGLPALSGLTGRFNLMEIERNLKKKMPAAVATYLDYLPLLNFEIVPLPSAEEMRPLYGAAEDKDLPVLASALTGRADFFVTGDKRLVSFVGQREGLPFRTAAPAEFLDRILPEILAGTHRR